MKAYTTPIRQFSEQLVDELDLANGAFTWWQGYTDSKRLVLLGDYLIQSVVGISDALCDAALSASEHQEKCFADDHWIITTSTRVAREVAQPTSDDFLRALVRGDIEEKRERTIQTSAMHVFMHLCQALDRAAAVIVVVAGLDTEVLTVGWPSIERWSEQIRLDKRPFMAPSAEGLELQKAVVDLSTRWTDHGPTDWLPWLVASRNAAAHRAPMTKWHFLKPKTRSERGGFLRPFFKQPSLSEMHSMGLSPARASGSIDELVIVRDSSVMLQGLIDSTGSFLAFLIDRLTAVWERRREDPTLVIQSGRQWRIDAVGNMAFEGWGPRANVMTNGPVHVGRDLSRRLQAAKVMDADRDFWA